MSYESEQALRPQLARGERLLWSGMPRQGLRLRATDALMIPFSLMWGGFAVFWEYSVARSNAPLVFKLWGVPFVCTGLFLIFGRFFADSVVRKRTYYGLTDQRILILGGWRGRQLRGIELAGLSEVGLNERADRSGTITFGPTGPLLATWPKSTWNSGGRTAPPCFEMIEDARKVYELIREAQRGSAPRGLRP